MCAQALPKGQSPSFLSTGVRTLNSTRDAALMSGVLRNGERSADARRVSIIHQVQSYVIRNNSTVWGRGENTIFTVPLGANVQNNSFMEQLMPVYETKITRDGSIIGYIIREVTSKRQLLKVHFHGDTSNPLSRTFKAFLRSPVPKWDVENYGLYGDLREGTPLGFMQEVFPDSRVMFPKTVAGMPRLEMQVAAALGRKYYLAVTDVPEPVGEVDADILGRFAPRSEAYMMTLRNCTSEEAILWLNMVIATDMKRRKSQNARYGSPFLPVYV